MGVHDLWRLLAPCGHRISIDTLSTQRLAIDISIWLIQFIRGMRDEEGNIQHNAHLIGLFKRILRLLYHGIQPIFVFDGLAPRLKKQTILQRKLQREHYSNSIKRMAEKLLLAQLKMKSIQQLK